MDDAMWGCHFSLRLNALSEPDSDSPVPGFKGACCVVAALAPLSCAPDSQPEPPLCALTATTTPPVAFSDRIGCASDFEALASPPISATVPGARSVKTSIDREAEFALSFQNTSQYPRHWDFLSNHRSAGQALPAVGSLAQFNLTEYTSPDRRFVLGALTHYAGANRWVYELSPYDTADANMIAEAYQAIADSTYFGPQLLLHPTSEAIASLGSTLPQVSTDELLAGSPYQPLNLAESMGRLRFLRASEVDEQPIGFRDIVVLDSVPNDISVTVGLVTDSYQTPLSHLNVLSQNRGTPNMAFRGAFDDPQWRALDGQWVRLRVEASHFELEAVGQEQADAWWEGNRPETVQVPGLDEQTTALTNMAEIVDATDANLLEQIGIATRAFGGKAANYAVLAQVPEVPVPPAFAVPIAHYLKFLRDNGFEEHIRGLLEDPLFLADATVRRQALSQLRTDMTAAPIDPILEAAIVEKLNTEFPGQRMRFRSSTNAEDLPGFTGAGLYTSKSGDPNDPTSPVADAIRKVWASVWRFRAFEERFYRSIDHLSVGMALLVHRSFPDEEANGVALTANPFDRSNDNPAFYVNVQLGEHSVVEPEPGVTTEQYLHYYYSPNRPISYLQSSSLKDSGRVLDSSQAQQLGAALQAITQFFAPAYASRSNEAGWWAMDVEFKFDGDMDSPPELFVKQARPFGSY